MFINFVWHFHQPLYRHPESGEYLLPWVNFHTTRNYWQMLRIIEETEFPCTINLVPCLLEQIIDYAENRAADSILRALQKPPEKLTEEEISRLKRFFPQFHSIYSPSELQKKVLISFFSPLERPEEKSREELFHLREKIFSEIIGYFGQLKNKKLLELTISPYYHPLLPMLIDSSCAREEAPDLPEFQHPEDASWQLTEGKEYFLKFFGFSPSGLWPSEGALSRAACQQLAMLGFNLTFTDENLLWKSLDCRPDLNLLYQAYDCARVSILFRDRELSDLIGFEYHRWPTSQAVSDFIRKLDHRAEKVPEKAICSIILDGENPWGGYSNNGLDFLRLLFDRIKESRRLRPVLSSDYLKTHRPQADLNLKAGTWMSSFFKWVGHPDKVAAWKKLAAYRNKNAFSRFLAVAEGSDWFWWAGETKEKEFELLFSAYLEKAAQNKE